MSGPTPLWPQGGGTASWPPSMPHRVRLDSPAETVDSEGRRSPGWAPFREDVPAFVRALTGRDYIAAQTAGARVDTRIVVPWFEGIETTMRVVHGTTIYSIRAVLPDETQHLAVTLLCDSGASRG